jgi:DeoR/GlpR family transcriptional regulator of sugar metabolism
MIGGTLQPENKTALGSDAMAMLARYFADFAFIGGGAISPAGWVMDYTPEEADLYNLMLRSARVSVVVADHSKFNQHTSVRVTSLQTVTYLITDRPPASPVAEILKSFPVELITAGKRRAQ